MRYILYAILIIVFTTITCCQDEEFEELPVCNSVYKIGMILPLSGPDKSDWHKVTDWVLENIKDAGCIAGGRIELIWYDSYSGNVEEIADEICQDTSILAAIGPFTSSESFTVADLFINARKPLLLPTATSADISSAFSGKKYIWRLVESDIAQCQVLLIIAKNKGAKKVALVTGDDQYGLSFYNWFSFLATEMDMEVTAVEKFDQANELPDVYISEALSTSPDILVAVPKNVAQAVAMARIWRNSKSNTEVLFSDAAYLDGFMEGLENLAEGIEGTAFTCNPATGFTIAFKQKYQTNPTLGMAQIYDAILLLAYALELSGGKTGFELANSLMELSDGTDAPTFWDKDAIRRALDRLKSGQRPEIIGASGTLKFAADYYTDIVSSTYLHWQVYNNRFLNLSYYSSDGRGRVSRLAAAWQSYASKTQAFDTSFQPNLPPRSDLWAMIVATSQGWSNYRHQADALRIYHFLKSNGLDDDHIILCMADDLANNSRNPERNTVIDALTGENIYQDFSLDYKIQNLSSQDLMDILSCKRSVKLTQVLTTDNDDNILLYFLGHGKPDGIIVQGESTGYLTPSQLDSTLSGMYENYQYRRILVFIEACYSGVFEACEGIPSVLYITAANRFESSKAAVFDLEIDVWLSNQFTNEWLKIMQTDTDLTFSELYLQLCKTVYGSHVCIFNSSEFGNVYNNSIKEFVLK
jgi:ABC-type branched-subunit amino acid transport system substrate-binding protein